MAMRRDVLASVEGFDERFRWYRTADIELSFRIKDRGLRTEVVPLPVVKHEHRMWFETDPATLFCIASGEISTREALKTKALNVTGDRTGAEHFLSFFSFDEPRHSPRDLEHV